MPSSFVAPLIRAGVGRSSVPVKIRGSPYSPGFAIYIYQRVWATSDRRFLVNADSSKRENVVALRAVQSRTDCMNKHRANVREWHVPYPSHIDFPLSSSDPDAYVVAFGVTTSGNAACECSPGQTAALGQKARSFVRSLLRNVSAAVVGRATRCRKHKIMLPTRIHPSSARNDPANDFNRTQPLRTRLRIASSKHARSTSSSENMHYDKWYADMYISSSCENTHDSRQCARACMHA